MRRWPFFTPEEPGRPLILEPFERAIVTPPAIRCDGCRHWKGERDLGMPEECRRHAPIAVAGKDCGGIYRPTWPHTKATDYCGDFEARR